MRKGGGKEKGSAFERWVAKELSLWLTGGQRNDLFWRTHSSGGLGTISKKKNEYGDIMSIDDEGRKLTDKYNIECRHGKCLDLKHLIYSIKSSSLISLIVEGRTNSKLSERKPLWIIKEQNRDVLVMMDRNDDNIKSLVNLVEFFVYDVIMMKFEDWKREFKII